MAAIAPQVIASCENTPANIQVHGQKREALGLQDDAPLAKRAAVMQAPAALYPKPIDASESVSYHKRMSALFHDMEREIAGEPEEPVPEVAEQPLVVLDPEQLAAEALAEEEEVSKKATSNWRKFHGLAEAEEPKPAIEQEWWTMPTPGRKLHKQHQKEWSQRGDDLLAKIEEELEACGKVLEESKPKDWWTMPTPARKNKRQSIANRAQRQDDLIKLMEEMTGSAQAVIEKSQASDGKKVTFDTAAAFSDDEDEEMEDVAEEPKEEAKEEAKEEPKEEAKEEPKEAKAETKAKWTMKTLPLKKVSTLAKMQAFAKKHSKAIGGVPKPKSKAKDAFWTSLLDALKTKGLLA